jgi:hypothetical protein
MAMKTKELENWENVKYRMREEGFDYCFRSYSWFEEIEDEEFHKLRLKYIKSAKKLEKYIKNKVNVLRSSE